MDRVRLAIVGCGNISRLNAPGYLRHPRGEAVALCDTVPECAKRRAQEWGDWRLGFDRAAADFVDGLLECRQPAQDVQAAKRMLQVPLAIDESGRTGRRVAPESVT